jgi:D-alanyl-D-alanine carboxypeptidase/D-alanyl-D-alanine-endopeptidase (penicillin-binding protein 4)
VADQGSHYEPQRFPPGPGGYPPDPRRHPPTTTVYRRQPRRGRAGLVAALAALVVLGLALVSLLVVRPGPIERWLAADRSDPTPPASPVAAPSPVLAGVAADAPAPTQAGVKAVLDPLLANSGLGGRVSISVTDAGSGQSLYARGPDNSVTPASTTKLVTAVTVLAARGGAYRIATRAVAGDNPGEIVLVGGGDPTLAAGPAGTYPGAARLDELAAQVRQALGGTAPTKIIVDSTLFSGPVYGPSWDADIASAGYGAPASALMTDGARVDPKDLTAPAERYQRPDIAAGQAFARALGLPSSAVVAGRAPASASGATAAPPSGSGTAVAPGARLGQVESLPLARLVEIMLNDSDNVIAEALARQVALAKGQQGSYSGAAAAMAAVLKELGLRAAESGLVDGSGLSRADRLTPSLLTDILTLSARPDRPELHPVFSGLPVAGYSGTLRDRYRSAGPTRPGAGVVRAKTGTLSGVNAISGIVITQEGRLLAFAAVADQTTSGPAAEQGLDRIAAALAGCGCR